MMDKGRKENIQLHISTMQSMMEDVNCWYNDEYSKYYNSCWKGKRESHDTFTRRCGSLNDAERYMQAAINSLENAIL